jgi:hypothetical protein
VIPKTEFDALAWAAREAFSAAADGRIARACLLLTVGRQSTRRVEAAWANRLMEFWDLLILRLKESYPSEAFPEGF